MKSGGHAENGTMVINERKHKIFMEAVDMTEAAVSL